MNADLMEVIKAYATKSHSEVTRLLQGKSQHNIISILLDLLTTYFNDKNSSTLRESVVVSLCGFVPAMKKIGYNGYKHDSIGGVTQYCEAKPKNINTNDAKPKKLNGGGNFTDYTWGRFKKDKDNNPTMLIAGFIDGRLICIFEFPFAYAGFTAKLETQLQRRFPKGDKSGEYLRSASFGLADYQNAPALVTRVFVNKQQLQQYESHITGGLYSLLEKESK